MSANFTQFMLNLAKDPNALKAFEANPNGAMTNAGLSQSEITAVTSKNHNAIQSAVTQSSAALRRGGAVADASDIVVVVIL